MGEATAYGEQSDRKGAVFKAAQLEKEASYEGESNGRRAHRLSRWKKSLFVLLSVLCFWTGA